MPGIGLVMLAACPESVPFRPPKPKTDVPVPATAIPMSMSPAASVRGRPASGSLNLQRREGTTAAELSVDEDIIPADRRRGAAGAGLPGSMSTFPLSCSAIDVHPVPSVTGLPSSQFCMPQPATTQLSAAGAADRFIENEPLAIVARVPVAVAPAGVACWPASSKTCSIEPSAFAPEFDAETVVDAPVVTGAVQMVANATRRLKLRSGYLEPASSRLARRPRPAR